MLTEIDSACPTVRCPTSHFIRAVIMNSIRYLNPNPCASLTLTRLQPNHPTQSRLKPSPISWP